MKTIFALLALLVSPAAFSACYMIYAPTNELVWRGPAAPVPMDTLSIHDEIQKMVPNGQLVILLEYGVRCSPLDLIGPRKTMGDKARELNNG